MMLMMMMLVVSMMTMLMKTTPFYTERWERGIRCPPVSPLVYVEF